MMGEIDSLVARSTKRLLSISSPPVRYWALRQIEGRDEDDDLVVRALEECADYRPKVRLLDSLRKDGTWPISKAKKAAEDKGPGQPIGFTYRVMLWNLFTLAEYAASPKEGNLRASLEKLLGWVTKDGYIPGPWSAGVPLPYFNGYALHDLVRFGKEKDPRAQRMTSWLLSMQRADGGWNMPYIMDVRNLPEYRGLRMKAFMELLRKPEKPAYDPESIRGMPSCTWCTYLVTWGLAQSARLVSSKAVRRGCDLVLDRFFKKNTSSTYYLAEEHWTKLTYPARFGNGLTALDVLTKVGYGPDDPRMEKPIRWLLQAKGVDGLWRQSTDRPTSTKDDWISLIALRTLARYSQAGR